MIDLHITDFTDRFFFQLITIGQELEDLGLDLWYSTRPEPTSLRKRSIDAVFRQMARNPMNKGELWILPNPLEDNGPVFGYTQGLNALVSTYELSEEEVVKVIKHEIGHILGLPHCPRECVMRNGHPSTVPATFCRICKNLMKGRVNV